MTREQARERAETIVYCYYTRSTIESQCRKRSITITKNRGKMEQALIEKMTEEMTTEKGGADEPEA